MDEEIPNVFPAAYNSWNDREENDSYEDTRESRISSPIPFTSSPTGRGRSSIEELLDDSDTAAIDADGQGGPSAHYPTKR